MPKIRIDNLMRTVAHAFGHSDLMVTATRPTSRAKDHGLIALMVALARAADRLSCYPTRTPLDAKRLRPALEGLDRRSSHYRTALALIALIHHGARLGEHAGAFAMPLSDFTRRTHKVLERFLGRYLAANGRDGARVSTQDVRSNVFTYLENAGGWNQVTIRPDVVLRQRRRGIVVAAATYKSRHEHPPSPAESCQPAAHGLACASDLLLPQPLACGGIERATTLLFAPPAASRQVRIRLVGVPVDGLLDGVVDRWWALAQPRAAAAPHIPAFRTAPSASLGNQLLGGR